MSSALSRQTLDLPAPAQRTSHSLSPSLEQGDGLGEDDAAGGTDQWAATPPTPLFKLTPGMSANSHGIACAQVAGEGSATSDGSIEGPFQALQNSRESVEVLRRWLVMYACIRVALMPPGLVALGKPCWLITFNTLCYIRQIGEG